MKKIVFVKRRPHIRVYKIAKVLKQTGRYNLICICDYNCFDYKLFNGIFDKVYYFRKDNKNNFIYRIKGYNRINKVLEIDLKRICKILGIVKPDIVHCFSEPYDYIKYIIEKTEYPVVLSDGNDFSGISSGIENIDKKTREEEKYCFENVSGICHKGPEFEIDYYRQYGYKINCPELQFMDYCDENFLINNNEVSYKKNEINLVYAGAVSLKSIYKNYLSLFEKMRNAEIHLHIYSNPWQYKNFIEYLEVEKKEKYFHFHKPVSLKELSKEITKYDWGLWIHPVYGNEDIPRAIKDKQKVAIGNKLFSYLEAGLLIIVSDHLEYGKEIVEKYKIGFAIKDEELPNLRSFIEKQNYSELKENVLKAREELSLSNQVWRLEKFYDEIINR